MDSFAQDLGSLFLEEDAVSAEFAIEDTRALAADISRQLSSIGSGSQGSDDQGSQAKVPGSVEDSNLVENTSISAEGTDYAEVTANLFRTVFTIPDTIAVYDLGGGDVGSPIKAIF